MMMYSSYLQPVYIYVHVHMDGQDVAVRAVWCVLRSRAGRSLSLPAATDGGSRPNETKLSAGSTAHPTQRWNTRSNTCGTSNRPRKEKKRKE